MKKILVPIYGLVFLITLGLCAHFFPVLAATNNYLFLNGNVGIGGDPGGNKLQVTGGASYFNGAISVNEGWNPDQQLSINSNQIWKSNGSGADQTLYLQWSTSGGNVVVGGQSGATNSLFIPNGNFGVGTFSTPSKMTIVGSGSGIGQIGATGCGGSYTGLTLGQTSGPTCGTYNILSAPNDQNLYINRPSGDYIYFREGNSTEAEIQPSGGLVSWGTGGTWGLEGVGGPYGVYGQGTSFGIYGYGTGSYGVFAYNSGPGWALYAEAPAYPLYAYNTSNGCGTNLAWGGYGLSSNCPITAPSSKKLKENFSPVDSTSILSKIDQLPISEWSYKSSPSSRHIGPFAEDFNPDFGVNGGDNSGIVTTDEDGVALVGIQALSQEVKNQQQEIDELKQEIQDLKNQK